MTIQRVAIDEILTGVRASSATIRNAAGVRSSVGNNVLRRSFLGGSFCLLAEETRTNLLLNSETLATQSVTVTNVAHTLSFDGTGTVTLSGASTDGPLVGTGATDRVSLTFTPTAGSLTLTVSGSVTFANLEVGALGTSPIITAGSAVTRQADRIALNAGLLSQIYGGGPISVLTEFEAEYVTGGGAFSRVWQMDVNNDNFIGLTVNEPGGTTGSSSREAGAFATWSSGVAYTSGAVRKIAVRYQSGNFAQSIGGGAVAASSATEFPAGLINLGISNDGFNTGTNPIRLLRLRRMIIAIGAESDAGLQAWSA